jgi:hypothetical protein
MMGVGKESPCASVPDHLDDWMCMDMGMMGVEIETPDASVLDDLDDWMCMGMGMGTDIS